ncbi:hypothetical protein GQ53DRAFT_685109 [Thozetella sp. PMI_491]|nr:hypothetical protein GQ53DRAFT_685109 [Thozetella sp. PMI_491]
MAKSLATCLTLLCLCVASTVARPQRGPASQPTRSSRQAPSLTKKDNVPDAQSTICGEIIDQVNLGFTVFYASDAYACLKSVPFNAAVATRFVDYYNTTVQFQSTLSYLKTPPAGYQQPALDVVGELGRIKENINKGAYPDQYTFEADLQNIVYRIHDSHVDLYAGILASFVFASPFNVVSASKDGKEPPKLYLKDDIVASHEGTAEGPPLAITAINGVDVTEYLTQFAALQSVGLLEPHGDWNALMSSPAEDIQGNLNIFGGGLTFYPGDDMNVTFADNTTTQTWWLAFYSEPYYTGPLTTGGDFFNYFVLGLLPASFNTSTLPAAFLLNETDTDTDDTSSDDDITAPTILTPFNLSSAYPEKPDVLQSTVGFSGGIVSGYFLNDTGTGVVSIPTFDQISADVGQFSKSVREFINRAQTAKLSKIIIDLQGNTGGLVELAFVTFRQFFPDQTPFAGSRRRSHELANVLGEAFTTYWENLAATEDNKVDLQANEWVVGNRLNAATGKNFSSWKEYYGPLTYNGDKFSLVEQYDLANEVFDSVNFEGWIPVAYTDRGANPPPAAPWKAENVVVLTDGECSSTCALFVEMLTAIGVRSVVAGGRPVPGPMQAVSGTRGAHPYSSSDLDSDISQAGGLSESAAAALPQVRDSGIFIDYAGFNLRDQVRKDDKTGAPLQFTYIPANCRLYYTLANAWNMSALWRDVDTAVWKDPSKCVEGSSDLKAGSTITTPPAPTGEPVRPTLDYIEASDHNEHDGPGALADKPSGASKAWEAQICAKASDCKDKNFPCQTVEFKCAGKSGLYKNKLCVGRCLKHGSAACTNPNHYGCGHLVGKEGHTALIADSFRKSKVVDGLYSGVCVPYIGTTDMCNAKNGAKKVPNSDIDDDVSLSGGKQSTNNVATTDTWSIEGNTAKFSLGLLGDIWI